MTRRRVHLWCAQLDLPAERLAARHRLLSDDERRRTQRFHFAQDQARFIAGRGTLRLLLGHYLACPPEALAFGYTPYGKPYVQPENETALRFNVSHAGGLALYAVARGRAVGVDLEPVRTLPPPQQPLGFFNCWTRKEAYIKARGFGLSLPLDQFDVSLGPGEPARLLATRPHPHEAAHWKLHALSPAPGFVAALAVEGRGWTAWCRRWPEDDRVVFQPEAPA